MGYRRDGLVVFVKGGDVQPPVAGFLSVQLSQACLGYLVDGAAHLIAPEWLDAGAAAPPPPRPAGEHQPVVRQDGAEFRLAVRAACLHLLFAQVAPVGEVVEACPLGYLYSIFSISSPQQTRVPPPTSVTVTSLPQILHRYFSPTFSTPMLAASF